MVKIIIRKSILKYINLRNTNLYLKTPNINSYWVCRNACMHIFLPATGLKKVSTGRTRTIHQNIYKSIDWKLKKKIERSKMRVH